MLASAGAGPLELTASTLPFFFINTSAKRSPPGPQASGFTTAITHAAASAASTPLPPSCTTLTPANAPRLCPAETIPFRPMMTGRADLLKFILLRSQEFLRHYRLGFLFFL